MLPINQHHVGSFPSFLVPVGAVGVRGAPLELSPLNGDQALAALNGEAMSVRGGVTEGERRVWTS